MTHRYAPVDLRVDSDGHVWHVGNPEAWGKGANPTLKQLTQDEIKFIGPDVKAPWIQFEARLVALTDEERRVIARALESLARPDADEDVAGLIALAQHVRGTDR